MSDTLMAKPSPGARGQSAALGNTRFRWKLAQVRSLASRGPIWLMILLALIIAYIARRLPFGRHVYAIGDNERAAELSGVKVKQIKVLVYPLSGFAPPLPGSWSPRSCWPAIRLTVPAFEDECYPAPPSYWAEHRWPAAGGTILGTLIGAFVISFRRRAGDDGGGASSGRWSSKGS